jgi:cyclic pyranopterin phosphate synthase
MRNHDVAPVSTGARSGLVSVPARKREISMKRKIGPPPRKRLKRLSHLDKSGTARMVDVSAKRITLRRAVATAQIHMKPQTLKLLWAANLPKGDALGPARLAAILAAKRTHELIPLCHPLPLDHVDIKIEKASRSSILITASTQVRAKTGVEMEALTAAAVAALTIYDMCKAVDRAMTIGPIRLEEKSGGASGSFSRR